MNTIWPFIGNDHAFNFLSKSIKANKLAQTYIFKGISNVGKTRAATQFAKILLCNSKNNIKPCGACLSCENLTTLKESNSDLYILKKDSDKKDISTEQVRDFIHNLSMSSFNNGYKIGIIKSAHHLNSSGFNALLKTLEEPNKKVIIILTTSSVTKIPMTIISRSQILRFKSVGQNLIYDLLIDKYKAERSEAKNLSHMCLGKPAIAIKLLENKEYQTKYINNINIFVDFNTSTLEIKLKKIEEIFPQKQEASVANLIAQKLIEAWLALLRDCLLLKFNQKIYVQHTMISEKLNTIQKNKSIGELLNIQTILKKSNRYLACNVSPKNVFDYIAINI
ncbi:hypothetical protein ISS03_05080 [Patescibacteria group bacterium]|nr:hypothetical protein [Patescibacteria group bacterium]